MTRDSPDIVTCYIIRVSSSLHGGRGYIRVQRDLSLLKRCKGSQGMIDFADMSDSDFDQDRPRFSCRPRHCLQDVVVSSVVQVSDDSSSDGVVQVSSGCSSPHARPRLRLDLECNTVPTLSSTKWSPF